MESNMAMGPIPVNVTIPADAGHEITRRPFGTKLQI